MDTKPIEDLTTRINWLQAEVDARTRRGQSVPGWFTQQILALKQQREDLRLQGEGELDPTPPLPMRRRVIIFGTYLVTAVIAVVLGAFRAVTGAWPWR